ncbi:tetratricopeptide repeat protein 27-like [Hydractinia symbiolongicarpus]|uniref:tetratricopeptide repeat protein 27-like n=1 Tax=Hydractinia symbiolongicarpus TaxID=13093 RepID=UPI00254DA4CC|nr:tetratricopeptide repeat protein 27-like [Hydractinia symbiolongicarpus]
MSSIISESMLLGEVNNNGLNIDPIFKCIIEENWKDFLIMDDVQSIIDVILSEAKQNSDFSQKLLTYIKQNIEDTFQSHSTIALFGIMCLKVFIQANWTGPEVNIDDLGLLGDIIASKDFNSRSLKLLESYGEDVYQLVSYPTLLVIAKAILHECHSMLNLFVTTPLWSVKCAATYFTILEETTGNHFEMFKDILKKVKYDETGFLNLPIELQAEFYLDCSHVYLRFYEYNEVEKCHKKVKQLLKIEVSLTAALGKRTKFQEKNLPQMKLDVVLNEERAPTKTNAEITKDLPTDITLDNDTLLPEIRFIDAASMKNPELTSLDQAYAISSCIFLQKTRPRDKLSHEEVLPFVENVLKSPQCWSIQYKSLFLRCVTEFSNSRKAERALLQFESLRDNITKQTPKASQRCVLLQSVNLEPSWACERVHAQLLFSIGLTDSALEIFLRLHLWDDVIACYQRLGKHGKAEAVIREELTKRESATLWNLLGDATLDKQYYEKAWEVSKYRNARSQRSIGLHHLRKREFNEAIPYFEKSLELNYLQPSIAFSLGCACMTTNKLGPAAKAFQHCVSLDCDNHEAWNNLASSFIRLNRLPKAYKALQEATRLSYDNWKIWENFLLVCTDIGAFDETIHCCYRLVDLDRKEIDIEVLHIIVKAVLDDEKDMKNIPAGRLKPKLYKMFAHVTSKITNSPAVWELYAKLHLSENEATHKEKALQYLYKSHRCFTQNTEWEKCEKRLPAVKRVTHLLMDVTKDVCSQAEFETRAVSLYSTTKMAVTNLILRLEKAYASVDNEPLPSVLPIIEELKSHVNELQTLLTSSQ